MRINTPLPQSLPKECQKAAKILKSFVDGRNDGLDGVIPRQVLSQAKGFAIFTIVKAGFLFSARAGTGIVIAKLDDGSWSAPSAIGSAGVGFGGQVGAEVTDFIIVLNSKSAVRSFMAAGSLTLGGNLSVAIGPIGRNGEAGGSLNTSGKVAAMYSYSKTRGVFAGLSIEGSVIMERQDANALAYSDHTGGTNVTAKLLLGGAIDPPEWAQPLITTLQSCTGLPGNRPWIESNHTDNDYTFNGLASPSAERPPPSFLKKKNARRPSGSNPRFPPDSWNIDATTGVSSSPKPAPYTFDTPFESDFVPEDDVKRHHPRLSISERAKATPTDTESGYPSVNESYSGHSRSFSSYSPTTKSQYSGGTHNRSVSHPMSLPVGQKPYIAPKADLVKPLTEGIGRAIALFDFAAAEPGDLGFAKGDVITILKKSDSTDDWWTGKCNGRQGIFPANFVELVRQ